MSEDNRIEMLKPKIGKVTVSMGVGEAGERLVKAEKILGIITSKKPVRCYAKNINRDFGIRKGMPIGCKVTLRKDEAIGFLRRSLKAKNDEVLITSFDREGNFSFGISEYTDLEGVKYYPDIGMFGMDVCVTMEKTGYRLRHRKIRKRNVPSKHRMKEKEAIAAVEALGVKVVE
jgi:LSU ribosomal protein L5P